MLGPYAQLLPFVASAATTARFVVQMDGTTGKVATHASATTLPFGVTMDAASADGDQVSVCIHGVCECIASAAIAAGVAVQSAGSVGRVVTLTESNGYALGVALEKASAAGDIIRVFINPTYVVKGS